MIRFVRPVQKRVGFVRFEVLVTARAVGMETTPSFLSLTTFGRINLLFWNNHAFDGNIVPIVVMILYAAFVDRASLAFHSTLCHIASNFFVPSLEYRSKQKIIENILRAG
jgi:hypothetical protein